MRRHRISLVALFLSILLLICVGTGQGAPSSSFRVSFINVGQGDAFLLHDGNFDVLIDGGPSSAGPAVVAYLQQLAIGDVDVMIATHAHDDHVGGLVDVLESIPVKSVYYNGYPETTTAWNDFWTAVSLAGLGAPVALQYSGTPYSWGSTTVSVLGPEAGLSSPDQNDASVVLLVQHGEIKYLFTGDMGSTAETAVVKLGTPVASQVLKVGHHGSATSSSNSFLSAVHPSEAIISVGSRNSYGHPSPDTLSRLHSAGARIWRTDQAGTVVVTDDGATYQVACSCAVFVPFLQLNGP